jgi:hypothetical protein
MAWSVQKKRAIVALAGIPLVLSLINYYAELHFFGSYDLTAVVVCTAAVFVVVKFFGKTLFQDGESNSD